MNHPGRESQLTPSCNPYLSAYGSEPGPISTSTTRPMTCSPACSPTSCSRPNTDGERNLRGLRKLIATPKKTLRELLTRMYNEASSDFVKETVGVFITMPEDTFSSVHSTT